MKKKIIILIIVILAFVVGAYFYQQRDIAYIGTIESTRVELPSRLATIVDKINYSEGDEVKKGDVVAELDCREIDISLNVISKEFIRAEKLKKSGSMPEDQFERVWKKKHDIDLKKSWCQIISPINGTIVTKYLEPSEWTTPGTKVVAITDLDEVHSYIYVDHDVLTKLQLNMEVKGRLHDSNDIFKGKITIINNEAEFTPKNAQTLNERSRLVYGVKVEWENSGRALKPGMSIEVQLPVEL